MGGREEEGRGWAKREGRGVENRLIGPVQMADCRAPCTSPTRPPSQPRQPRPLIAKHRAHLIIPAGRGCRRWRWKGGAGWSRHRAAGCTSRGHSLASLRPRWPLLRSAPLTIGTQSAPTTARRRGAAPRATPLPGRRRGLPACMQSRPARGETRGHADVVQPSTGRQGQLPAASAASPWLVGAARSCVSGSPAAARRTCLTSSRSGRPRCSLGVT